MIARLLQWAGPVCLLAASLIVFSVSLQRDRAEATAQQAIEQRDQIIRHANSLADELAKERTAQAKLRTTQNALRNELARRRTQIEELKHENQELREWAAQPLPAAARRLRERPALTGADAYRDWLSGRGAVPPAGDGAER
ncbi:Phage P2 LysB-like protein [Azotobacter vinelandii CA]|uniref:Phage P2 LysB-like protein n=2 Tax=Azotobacter vinelandii TaxID=354 RepID=C1DS22_AZOVD|nr:Phage P2 LysB-like protein [Azotobacter vinelandii DJ]AGK13690.1 Phage P2 LysB-like protein [Azotobacter vinelandii CA]AGK18240.1 Phage P2 LysB-like protein [Azotobacter vinelandii CA6]GLK62293.1 hypothetical protein GCM10017624_44570 [Azotobacter vinelandii]SFX44700.1 phage lysis regulatory protein, LysB family [Azotobacter vinelandii]